MSLVIPFSVHTELESISQMNHLVDKAVKGGHVQIQTLSTIPSIQRTNKLSRTDIELITLAQEIQGQGEEVVIASEDRRVGEAAASLGIAYIRLNGLEELMSKDTEIDQKINREAKSLLSLQKRELIVGFLSGFIANLLATLLWTHIDVVVATVTVWGTISAILCLGILMYTLRGRFRLHYGVFEFLFGIFIATKVFWPDFNYDKIKPTDILQVVGGIYVMVRGQDNIGKALQGTRFSPLWKRFSGES